MANHSPKPPVLSIAGVLVIVLYCAFTLTSIALFPRPITPVTDWLNDFGNSSYNPRGAVFYNVGCVLTGLALFPFFAGFYYWYTDNWRKLLIVITQVVGFVAAFALMMIGVFSENYGAIHRTRLRRASFLQYIQGLALIAAYTQRRLSYLPAC